MEQLSVIPKTWGLCPPAAQPEKSLSLQTDRIISRHAFWGCAKTYKEPKSPFPFLLSRDGKALALLPGAVGAPSLEVTEAMEGPWAA